jgi:hypothetical protein
MGKLAPIWSQAEAELGLNFISLRADDNSDYLHSHPDWDEAIRIMGRYGIGSSDAMIVNMFLCSKMPVLLTADTEMAECVLRDSNGAKRVFIPDSAIK